MATAAASLPRLVRALPPLLAPLAPPSLFARTTNRAADVPALGDLHAASDGAPCDGIPSRERGWAEQGRPRAARNPGSPDKLGWASEARPVVGGAPRPRLKRARTSERALGAGLTRASSSSAARATEDRPRRRLASSGPGPLCSTPAVASTSTLPFRQRRHSSTLLAQDHAVLDDIPASFVGAASPPSTAGDGTRSAASLSDASPEHTRLREKRLAQAGKGKTPALSRSAPRLDELNTLLRHPTLYDPVLTPRFPIVLCHGLYGFDVRGPAFFRLHYWGDLLRILRGVAGAEVFVTAVPGTGAIKQRAHALHQMLEDTPAVQGRDLNFLAHSMGGLDARYVFSNIKPTGYRPRSLTTLSTPHRGSEFMAWCRANIGIGTDFDETSSASARATHEEMTIPLPFSLKNPILSRAQVDAAKKAAEARKLERSTVEAIRRSGIGALSNKLPGLPYSLSTSLSSYLLDMLDSPAYANLTPSFLEDVFNPSTPDQPDIKYYSIAARTPKISILHPLWLPKVVLDGAESARVARGFAREPQWTGNDGLVTIESAKWGEFLGTIDACDHWELRGSSGLLDEAKQAKEAAKAMGLTEAQKLELVSTKVKSWQWQDVYALVQKATAGKGTKPEEGKAIEPMATAAQTDDAKGIASLASWITRRLPNSVNATSPAPASPATALAPAPATSTLPAGAMSDARMLYGGSVSAANPDKFNLERMCLAVCRKLHNEGL